MSHHLVLASTMSCMILCASPSLPPPPPPTSLSLHLFPSLSPSFLSTPLPFFHACTPSPIGCQRFHPSNIQTSPTFSSEVHQIPTTIISSVPRLSRRSPEGVGHHSIHSGHGINARSSRTLQLCSCSSQEKLCLKIAPLVYWATKTLIKFCIYYYYYYSTNATSANHYV